MPDVRLRITGKNVSKKALSDLRSDIAKTNKSLKESKDKVEDLREETEKFKEGLTGIGVAAGVAFTALSAVVIKATRDYARFAHEVATVSTMIREDVTRNTAILSKGVREIARTVPQSVSILNTALYDLLSASVPVNQSLTMLRQSGKAAVAGVSDVQTAANLATGTINALGMAFTEADKVFDVAFSTVRAGKVTFTELASAMGQVLPAAAKMGSTIDEVYGSIAFLTKNAMDAAMASVSFARALDGLGEKAAKLKDMGVRVFGERGEYLGILNIMGQIAKQMEGLTEEARVNLMKEMGFDIRAARAITVMATNLDAFRKTMDEVASSAGATEEAFDRMKDTLINQWVILKNNLRDLSIVMGETFGAPALAMINTLVDALQRLSDTQKRMVAWGTIVGVAISGITSALIAFVLLKPKLLVMGAAFAKVAILLAPFTIAAAAAGVAVAGMAWALNEYKKARKDVFTEAALAATASNITKVKEAIEEYGKGIKGLSKFLDEAKERGADLAKEYSEQTERLNYYKRMMSAAIIELRKLRGDTFGAAVATRDLRRGLINIDDILDEYAEGLTGAAKATGDATEGTKDYKAVIEAIFDPINALTKALGLQDLIWLQLWENMKEAKEALDSLSEGMKEAMVFLPEVELPVPDWTAYERYIKKLREIVQKGLGRVHIDIFAEALLPEPALIEDAKKAIIAGELEITDVHESEIIKKQELDQGYTAFQLAQMRALGRQLTDEEKKMWQEEIKAMEEAISTSEQLWDDFGGYLESGFANVLENFGHEMLNFKEFWKWNLDDIWAYFDHTADLMMQTVLKFADAFRDAIIRAAADALAAESIKWLKRLIRDIFEARKEKETVARAAEWSGNGDITIGVGMPFKQGGIVPGKLVDLSKFQFEIPKMQMGGIVRRPTLAAIGEGGPEAIIPLERGKVNVRIQGKDRGDVNIDKLTVNVNAVFPNADLENMDPARFRRIFTRQTIPAIQEAIAEGLLNPVILR